MSEMEQALRHAIVEDVIGQIRAIVGRWALGIIGAVAVLSAGAAVQWKQLESKVDNLERWRQERDVAIIEYRDWRNKQDAALAAIGRDIEWIRKELEKEHRK